MTTTRPTTAGPLRATTEVLDGPVDLLAEAGSEGFLFWTEAGGLAARGVTARLPLPRGLQDADALAGVTRFLQDIAGEDPVGRPGTGPVALGALPFDPAEAGELLVPEVIVGSDDRGSWRTTIAGPGQQMRTGRGSGAVSGAAAEPPDQFRLTPSMSHSEWKRLVTDTVEQIEAGEFTKVVLARRIDIEANRPFVVSDVLERLTALYPSCMVYSMGGFIGASPELLLSRRGPEVASHPLAGTVARSGDAHGDDVLIARLTSSDRYRREHSVVVESIVSALSPACTSLTVPDRPSVLGLRNVSHLATSIEGTLAGDESALDLVARIHPTPAVGGYPVDAAVRYLQKTEGFDRGRYAGPLGWVDSRGDGTWALGIRCAELDGSKARIYAGNGIVAGADPGEELAETQLKLQALLAALVRP